MSKGKRYRFYGTEFQIIGSYGSGKTITGATNANPCVITSTAHGLAKGDVIKVASVGGMTELNGRIFVVGSVTADTITLSGEDATNHGVYTSGGTASAGVFVGSCEQTQYSSETGATPVDESETNCGVDVVFGAPKLGSVTINYNEADTAYQAALASSRDGAVETCLKLAKPGYPVTIYDIGVITTMSETAGAGGTWTGSATLTRSEKQVRLA